MSKDSTQTSTVRPDASTQQWIDLWRQNITGAQGQLANPAYAGVRQNMMGDFDRQRAMATMQGNDLATKAGAFGGSRSAVLNSQLQDSVNRNETSALSNLDLQQNQEQFQRLLALLGLQGQAANVGGQTNVQTMPGNTFGNLLGVGATIAGLGIPGAVAGAIMPRNFTGG